MNTANFNRVRFLGLAFLMALLCAPASSADKVIVRKINVVGSMLSTHHEVKSKMRTREGKVLDRKVLEEDFRRLLKMVDDVQIKEKLVEGGKKVDLLVILRENEVVQRIVFRFWNEKSGKIFKRGQIKPSKLRKLISSKVNTRYDEGKANRDAREIEKWYREEFYYFAKVKVINEPYEGGIRLVYKIDEGGRMYVRGIKFRGNYSIEGSQLMKYMETKPGKWWARRKYIREKFKNDLKRITKYYLSKGFLDVKVKERPFQITTNTPESKWDRRDAYIYIDIEEGMQHRVGKISFKVFVKNGKKYVEGNGLVSDGDLRSVIKTMPGDVFSPEALTKDANAIRDVYGAYPSSRYFTTVWRDRKITEQEDVTDVVFNIREGREVIIEDVQILGLKTTRDPVARRSVPILPGEKIDSNKINAARGNLRALRYFNQETLSVKVEPVLENGQTDETQATRGRVIVNLEEAPTGKASFGVGYTESEGTFGEVKLEERNFSWRDRPTSMKELITGKAFKGGGETASIVGRAGTKANSFKAGWSNPWIFNRPILFGFNGFYNSREWEEWDERRVGGEMFLGKTLWKRLFAKFTYRLENVKMEDVGGDDESKYLSREEGSNTLSRGIFDLSWSTINNRWDPTSGYSLGLQQHIVGGPFAGDKDFMKTFAAFKWYHPFYKDKSGRPWVAHLRVSGATVGEFGESDYVPIYEMLYAGGLSTIRGFKYNRLSPRDGEYEIGGDVMQTNTIEVFAPVYQKLIRISAFYDVGGIWGDGYGEDDGESNGNGSYRQSVGVGLHVKTPLFPMPIRVYYAAPLVKEENDSEQSIHVNIFEAQF